jgi:hypothetical protein
MALNVTFWIFRSSNDLGVVKESVLKDTGIQV